MNEGVDGWVMRAWAATKRKDGQALLSFEVIS